MLLETEEKKRGAARDIGRGKRIRGFEVFKPDEEKLHIYIHVCIYNDAKLADLISDIGAETQGIFTVNVD